MDGRVLGTVVNPQVIPTWTRQTHLLNCKCRGELQRCEAYQAWRAKEAS